MAAATHVLVNACDAQRPFNYWPMKAVVRQSRQRRRFSKEKDSKARESPGRGETISRGGYLQSMGKCMILVWT